MFDDTDPDGGVDPIDTHAMSPQRIRESKANQEALRLRQEADKAAIRAWVKRGPEPDDALFTWTDE